MGAEVPVTPLFVKRHDHLVSTFVLLQYHPPPQGGGGPISKRRGGLSENVN